MRFNNQADWEAFENTGKMPALTVDRAPGFWARVFAWFESCPHGNAHCTPKDRCSDCAEDQAQKPC